MYQSRTTFSAFATSVFINSSPAVQPVDNTGQIFLKRCNLLKECCRVKGKVFRTTNWSDQCCNGLDFVLQPRGNYQILRSQYYEDNGSGCRACSTSCPA